MIGMNSGDGYLVRNECMLNTTLKSGTRKCTVQKGSPFEVDEGMYLVCRAFFRCRGCTNEKRRVVF